MIAVKDPKKLACCRCEYQRKHKCSNGWICSLTNEEGYPCFADAYDKLDNCPLDTLYSIKTKAQEIKEKFIHERDNKSVWNDPNYAFEYATSKAIEDICELLDGLIRRG